MNKNKRRNKTRLNKALVKRVLEVVELVQEMNNGNNNWQAVSLELKEEFPKENLNPERLRSIYRRRRKNLNQSGAESKAKQDVSRLGLEKLEDKLKHLIRRKFRIESLADTLEIPVKAVLDIITDLQFRGYEINLWTEGDIKYVQFNRVSSKPKQAGVLKLNQKADQIKFAVISDTHVGHRRAAIEELKDFIHTVYKDGVRLIFHAGDLVEGHYMSIRPDSIRELDAIGFDDQVALAINSLPKLDGLRYVMISGNHDWTFAKSSFANPVKTVAMLRDDISYLGHNYGHIYLNDKIDVALIHPTDGIGQNYSLKMRQHIERNKDPKRLARFIFMGHYHKYDHTHYKGIDGFIMPSFQKQSWFMSNNNLESVVGGIVLTLNVNKEGDLVSFTTEHFFYDDNIEQLG